MTTITPRAPELPAPRGAKGGHTPVEDKNTLRSTQRAAIVDILGEAPMAGLVNGLQSVYLDKVPVANADGSRNVEEFDLVLQLGGPTDEGKLAQSGFDEVQAEVTVGIEVRQAIPVVRTINDSTVNAVRVTLNVPQLTLSQDDGDTKGASFEYAIDVQSNGGGYVERHRGKVEGKCTTPYQRAIRIDLTAAGQAPWDIRVRRITADATESKRQDKFYWASYTRIKSVRMGYRHSTAAGVQFDARNFQSVPTRHYDMMGFAEWEVPTNFDPIARTYTGNWNGTFKLAWTNDPAWIYYGLATHKRFGLGAYVHSPPDKWAMYELSQWCNGQLPDGRGGFEPRYAINCVITTQVEALRLLQDIAAVFRGVTVYAAGSITAAWDAPRDPVAIYSPANVENGLFSYPDGSHGAKKSSCTCWYNDLSQFGKRTSVTWDDPELVAKYGLRNMELDPVGCTSPSQALRHAKWALYTTEYGDRMVNFRTGTEGFQGKIGEVFAVTDPSETGERLGGRVRAGSTATVVKFDGQVELLTGETYTLWVTYPDPADPQRLTALSRTVTSAAGLRQQVAVSPAFPSAPPQDAMWLLEGSNVVPTLWTYVSIEEVKNGDAALQYDVVGRWHEPGMWDLIEREQPLTPRPIRRLADAPTRPINLNLQEVVAQDGQTWRSTLIVGWEPTSPGLTYLVSWRYAEGTWVDLQPTRAQAVDIGPLEKGVVEVRVRATDLKGSPPSEALEGEVAIAGNQVAAADVLNLTLTTTSKGVLASWSPSTDFDYTATELRLDGVNPPAATPLATVAGTTHNIGWPAEGSHNIWARHLRRGGPPGEWAVFAGTYSGPQPLLDALDGHITDQQLDAALSGRIDQAAIDAEAAILGLADEIDERLQGDADQAKRTDTLEAHGDNLVRNAGFLDGGGYWPDSDMLDRLASGVPSAAPSDGVLRSTIRSRDMQTADLADLAYIPVKPGEVLDSSVWVGQTQGNTFSVGMICRCYGQSKGLLGDLPELVVPISGTFNGWRLLTGTIEVPSGAYWITPVLFVDKPVDNTTARYYFCRPLIQRRAGAAAAAQAAVVTEALARATQDAALASQITTVSANLASTSAALSTEVTARVSADAAQAAQITALTASLETEVNTLQANIDTVSAAQVSGDAALAATIDTVSARVNAKGSNLCGNSSFELVTGTNNLADGWVAYSANAVGTLSFGTQPGRLSGRAQRVSASALGTGATDRAGAYREITITPNRLSRLQVSVYARGTSGVQVRMQVNTMDDGVTVASFGADAALGGNYTRLWADVVVASNVDQLRVYIWAHSRSSVGAINLDIDDVLVEPGDELNDYSPGPGDTTGAYAAVTEERLARVTETGELSAQWSVKVDANGRWAGIQTRAGGDSSQIDLLADVVRIGNAVHGSESLFVVYNTPTVVNGITLPAGVYVRDLFFGVLNGDRIIARSISTESLVVGAVTAAQAGEQEFASQAFASASSKTVGPFSVVSLVTTGAPCRIGGHVDVFVSLGTGVATTVSFSIIVTDQSGTVLDQNIGGSVHRLAPSAGLGPGQECGVRIPINARRTFAAGTRTLRVQAQAIWWDADGNPVNDSGVMGVWAFLDIQENKV